MPRRPARDVNKLPRWAQILIAQLENEVADWKRRALDPLESDVFRQGNPRMRILLEEIPLPSDHIRFTVGGEELEVTVEDRNVGEPCLNVRSVEGRLDIEPQASNAIRVRASRRF